MDDEKAKKTLESTNSLLSKISEVIPQSHTPNTEKPTEEGIYLFFRSIYPILRNSKLNIPLCGHSSSLLSMKL